MTTYVIDVQISADTDEENYHEYLDWLDSEKDDLNDIMKMKHLMTVLDEPYQLNQNDLIDLDVEIDIEVSE